MNLQYLYLCGVNNLKGIDISETAISIGKARHPHLKLMVGNLANRTQGLVDWLGKDFDIVFTRAVLQHIPVNELSDILSFLNEAMKPEALLIISESNNPNLPFGRIEGHRVYNTFNHNWKLILSESGFNIVEDNPEYIIATKHEATTSKRD
jgi:2-polyprenyl-3-methyl-5-hydroxy-6-metoxy-1,4-benzoquinol methylase